MNFDKSRSVRLDSYEDDNLRTLRNQDTAREELKQPSAFSNNTPQENYLNYARAQYFSKMGDKTAEEMNRPTIKRYPRDRETHESSSKYVIGPDRF